MPRICSLELPYGVADTALAELWLCLEEHGIRTPDLRIQFPSSDLVRLTIFSDDSPRAVALLHAWAREWYGASRGSQSRLSSASVGYHAYKRRGKLRSVPEGPLA